MGEEFSSIPCLGSQGDGIRVRHSRLWRKQPGRHPAEPGRPEHKSSIYREAELLAFNKTIKERFSSREREKRGRDNWDGYLRGLSWEESEKMEIRNKAAGVRGGVLAFNMTASLT